MSGRPTPGRIFHDLVSRELVVGERLTDMLLAATLARAHVLLEGPPGVGKTTLARALGGLQGGWGRVQMTADTSPSDILGWEVYDPSSPGGMRFRKGPVFTPVLLVDEINRAAPRTQSALLEAMEERAVHVGEERHDLPESFLVIATQNPFDLDGTFVLPQSQLDRFGLRLRIDVQRGAELEAALAMHLRPDGTPEVATGGAPSLPAASLTGWTALAVAGDWLRVAAGLQEHLARHKRPQSPRAWICWLHLGRCLSFVRGLEHISAACLRELLGPVFLHRLEAQDDPAVLTALEGEFDRLLGQR